MTLTYFTARSTKVAHAFDMNEESVKMCFEGKTCTKWANGLMIYNSVNKMTPGIFLLPIPGQYT